MAEKQVVRQDVVQITWEVDDSPLGKIASEAKKFQSTFGKAVNNSESKFDDFAKSVSKGWNKAVDGAEKLKSKLDPLNTEINQLGKSALNAGKQIASGLGKTAVKSVKVLAKGVLTLGTAFGGLVGLSTKGYAEYEQLVGGVDTLFKDANKTVLKYANDAYKTAGMSANAYMETVTSFSASLIQSVNGDTKKAAKLANQAIIDMSDNANKMGTDMESIQNAYQGFAKQNYTMLDNLKLGYGGTKEEMQRLLKDAQKISGQKFDISSYADVVEAIHVIQKNMGIAGTTSKEASSTIQGSFLAMKAAASNFMTGMADPSQDIGQLVNNLTDSAVTFAKNLIPVIKQTVPRLAKGILEIGKELAPYIPPMLKIIGAKIAEHAPIIGQKFKELLLKAKNYLIANKGVIWDGFKTIAAEAVAMLGQLFTGQEMNVSEIKDKIQEITEKVMSFVGSIKENWPTIKKVIIGVVGAIGALKLALFACNAIIAINNGLMKAKQAIDLAMAAKTKIAAAAQWALNTSIMGCPVIWFIAIIAALIAIIIVLVKNWDKVKEVAVKCWDKIKEIWGKAKEWFNSKVIQPIAGFFSDLWSGIKETWGAVKDWFKTKVIDPVVGFFSGMWDGIKSIFSKIASWINEHVIQPVVNFFKGLGTVLFVIVAGIVGLICQGFLKIAGWVNAHVIQPVIGFFRNLWAQIKAIATGIWSSICSIWGKLANWVNAKIVQPIVSFFTQLWRKITTIAQNVWNSICSIWGKIKGWVNTNLVQPVRNGFVSLQQGIRNTVQKVWTNLCNIWGKISGWVNSNVISPVKSYFSNLWKNITTRVQSMKQSIVDAFKSAWDKVTGVWSGLKEFFKGIWNGLKDTGSALKDSLVSIWKDAVTAIAKPVNKLIGGANWVLEKLGSDKKIAEWQPYAKGTKGHPGGNAIVNDGRGAELVQMPNGYTFIPKGRNVMLPNAPAGMKVLDAQRTARLMGKSSPSFNYEGGIGDWEIWDFFDNAKGLANKMIEKFVDYGGLAGYALDAGKAMISTAKTSVVDWVKSQFKLFGGKGLGSYKPSEGVEQWRSTVVQALKMEGQHNAANVKRTLHQMQTESGGNPKAINNWDVNARKGTPSKGLMQVIDPTFKAYARKGYNKNIYDPLSNILASVRYAMSRYGSLEKAYRGVGYARGIGESRIALPAYTPGDSVSYSGASSTNNNNYSPSFTLNMSGTVDRTTERTIKRWVKEAMEDTFDSMSRTNPRLTEV